MGERVGVAKRMFFVVALKMIAQRIMLVYREKVRSTSAASIFHYTSPHSIGMLLIACSTHELSPVTLLRVF